MKKTVMMIAALAAFNAAHADGFVCQTIEGDLNVKVYNHVNPSQGTRVGSVMVLSDPGVSVGRKTIARFTEIDENLSSQGAHYEANVDLRFSDSSRKGEIVSGTKLGQLKTIILDLDFSYADVVEAGTEVPGHLILVKRNGDEIARDVECTRYLKN